MASRWKTFTPNSTLPAADVNDCLNPQTADHIPRAQEVGTRSVTVAGSATTDFTVTLASGRFTGLPRVMLTGAGTQAINCIYHIVSASSSSFTFRVRNTVTSSSSFQMYWHAIEM